MKTFRFPSAPGSQEAFVARSRLETAILRYGESMNSRGSFEDPMQARNVELAWDAVEKGLDALETLGRRENL